MGIKRKSKLWSQVGAMALMGGLAACGGEMGEGGSEHGQPVDDQTALSSHAGEGEGESGAEGENESGGGGEFGIDPELARQDPVVYLSALEVIRAHYLAGIGALEDGGRSAAAEMFAHPISEIYVDLEEVVIALGAENFLDLMSDASAAPFDGRSDEEVGAAVTRVLNAINAAETFRPATEESEASVYAKVMAGLIHRAVLQYQFAAAEPRAVEAYLDGFGFERAASDIAGRQMPAIRMENAALADALEAALAALAEVYPTAVRPEAFDGDVDGLFAASDAITAVIKS
ncbi:hypothetical protein [Maricaulis sp.]|uniref:hypothetical protein n=1 Tax=Maricaulis sp. TaxID=1486257 RepID=UPI001B2833CA|nr:hypothetical protein [Maricaulis sp.]MBO6797703.1 hypothetical protein [Maricaulis sp.]